MTQDHDDSMYDDGIVSRRELLARIGLAFAALEGSRQAAGASSTRTGSRAGGTSSARARGVAPNCLKGERIRWLVGWSPGGGYDAYSRLAEPFIERELDAEIGIDNVAGAAGRVAAATLARARPDGRTLGILDGSGILWSSAMDERNAPVLARDYTLLARIGTMQQVLVSGPRTGVKSMEELLSLSRRRRLVIGVTAAGSQNFATCAVLTHLFGIEADFVSGYAGSREVVLALLRGDFDATALNVESALDVLGPGRLVPLMQITPERTPHVDLAHVPYLVGTDGLVRRRPELFAGTAAEVHALADAMRMYVGFGRLFAAPPRLPDALRACLERAIAAALSHADFRAAAARAGRSVTVASAGQVRSEIAAATDAVNRVVPIAMKAARRTR